MRCMGILNLITWKKNMKKRVAPRYLIGLFCLLVLSACLNTEATPEQPASQTETPSQTLTESGITDLDPAVDYTLRIYPLRVGSSWVYEYLGYDESREVIWRVTETVVDAQIVDGYYVATMERVAELLDGVPPDNFINTPLTGIFWYLIDGGKVYRIDSTLHTNLSDASLELIVPLPDPDEGWYPDPVKRANLNPGEDGFRHASEPYQESFALDGSLICYNIVTEVSDGKNEGTFCETVGFFFFEQVDFENPVGFRVELKGFSLQN